MLTSTDLGGEGSRKKIWWLLTKSGFGVVKNKLRINQIQLHTVIQIIIAAGKCFTETQAIFAYILSKINIWQDSRFLGYFKA